MTVLYRLFDRYGDLLYIGISDSWVYRFSQHQAKHQWWHDVTRIELSRYSTRDEADTAERTAIRTEHPRHNQNLTVPEPTPDHLARLAEARAALEPG